MNLPANFEPLSFSEKRVLEVMFKGTSYEEAGKELCLARSTVAVHCRNIYLKMGVKNIREAVYLALMNGILEVKQL